MTEPAAVARQAAGAANRQIQDAELAAGALHLGSIFLGENLERLKLPPLTREAVLAADENTEVHSLPDSSLVLRRDGRALGQRPDDSELQRLCDDDDHALFIVFGLGLGHTARELRARTRAPIAIFEPDPANLRRVLELGPTDLASFDIFCTHHDITQAWAALFGKRRSVAFVPTPGYVEAYPEAATDLRKTLVELVQRSRVNDATYRMRAREWISDLLTNVEVLGEHPGFLALARKFRGVPAFIVGAGPSLGKNGHLLVQAQKKGIVFSVNTSARALAHYGAEPHVLACMESIDVSHLLSNLPFIDRVVRAFSLTAHPNTFRTGKGPLLAVHEALPQLAGPVAALTGHPGLAVCGSVSTLAFSLAQRLGCSPIVFVGQDLAYTDGRAYAPGTAYEQSRVEVAPDGSHINLNWCDTLKRTHNVDGRRMHESEPLTETVAWGGQGRVLTGIAFCAVRAWLEGAAVVLARETPDTRLVNATEGGARIAGFEELELAQLLESLPDREISAATLADEAQRAAAPISREHIANWAEAQSRLVRTAGRAARRLRRLAEVAHESARTGSTAVTRRLAKLDEAERTLSGAVEEAPLLDAWSWAVVDQLMEDQPIADDRDPHASAASALEFEARLGRVIEDSARQLEIELTQLCQRLRSQPPER